MKNPLVQYFNNITHLSPEEEELLDESSTPRKFMKGTMLLRAGEASIDSYFIVSGCVREYIVVDGEEKTSNFFTEGQWVISLNNFTPDSPKVRNWVCVEDLEAVVGNEAQAQEMFKQFPRFETISRIVMETVFAAQMNLLTSYLTDSPEQRYLKLLQTRPDIVQRVPQFLIASYLGVKPQSLSRIRKQMAERR